MLKGIYNYIWTKLFGRFQIKNQLEKVIISLLANWNKL